MMPSSSSMPSVHPSVAPSLSQSPSLQPSTSVSIQIRTHLLATTEYIFNSTSSPILQPTTELEGYVPNVSTLRNQIICGYQGWFAYPGDGAPINKWKHWFSHPTDASAEYLEVDMYPFMEEYDESDLKESNLHHRDGSKVKFFSSARPNVVKKHFEWMR
jgi:hypothetical protein